MNATLGGIGLLLSIVLLGCASPVPVSTNPPLQELKGAKKATVVLFPMYMESWKALDEERIRKYGCTYTTRDPELIEQLRNLIVAKVKVISHPGTSWEQEPRELIYLELADGAEVKLRFGEVYANQNEVRGVFVRKEEETALSAELSFPKLLYAWAAKADRKMPRGGSHDEKGCLFVHDHDNDRS